MRMEKEGLKLGERLVKKKGKKTEGKKLMKKRKQLAWDKLDNTANLFPVIATQNMTNVFRISVSLTEEIRPDLLQAALDKVLPWFQVFCMRLRHGIFWYYFEENTKNPPRVMQEQNYPGAYIDRSKNAYYLFRVTYYKKRINLEVFHALTDGSGAVVFLKELLYQYLRLAHKEILKVDKDRVSSGISLEQEDSYVKNFKKAHSKVYQSEKAHLIDGEKLNKGELGVIHGYISLPELKRVSKQMGVTINQFLVAVMIYSIYKEDCNGAPSKTPISVSVPVNLRPYYDSHTMKNFFAMVSAVFKPNKESYTLEEIVQIVAENLKQQVTPENLDHILSYNVANEKNLVLRSVPLFIKSIVMKKIYGVSARANSTTVTNIGNIELKEPYQKYVEHFYVTLSMSKGQNIKGGVCSYDNILVFTFSSILKDVAIQKCFFKTFGRLGIPTAVESNGVYYESM